MKTFWLGSLAASLIVSLGTTTLNAEDAAVANSGKLHTYFGTYTNGDSKGIYHAVLDRETGKLSEPELAAEIGNSSFLAVHPNQKTLYAVRKEGEDEGGVVAFAIDQRTGKLRAIGKHAFSGGGPCYLAVEHIGKCLLAANFHQGKVAALAINPDGTLNDSQSVIQHEGSSVDPKRQKGPHAHSIVVDPTNRFAVCADLGLDKLLVYDLNAQAAKISPHDPPSVSTPAGGGPRHFVFHPNKKFAFANNEITCDAMAFAYDSDKGELKLLQTLPTLPADFNGRKSTAEILLHPNGKFLYVSNRGHETIAIFSVDPETGKLAFIDRQNTGGEEPRNFCIDPSGKWLVVGNQNTHNVVVFAIDPNTGLLKKSGSEIKVPSPVVVRFVPVDEAG